MKKLLIIASFALFGVFPAAAQTKAGKTIDKVEHTTAHTATVVGAKVTDKKLKNVKGPHGEAVYVDKYDRRYYVNKVGKRIFLKKK